MLTVTACCAVDKNVIYTWRFRIQNAGIACRRTVTVLGQFISARVPLPPSCTQIYLKSVYSHHVQSRKVDIMAPVGPTPKGRVHLFVRRHSLTPQLGKGRSHPIHTNRNSEGIMCRGYRSMHYVHVRNVRVRIDNDSCESITHPAEVVCSVFDGLNWLWRRMSFQVYRDIHLLVYSRR